MQSIPFFRRTSELSGNAGATYNIINILELLSIILGWAVMIAGLFFFFCILVSGIQWMLESDNSGSIGQARSRLTNCLYGFGALTLAYAATIIVQYFLGITIIQLPGTTYTPPEYPITDEDLPGNFDPGELPPAGGSPTPTPTAATIPITAQTIYFNFDTNPGSNAATFTHPYDPTQTYTATNPDPDDGYIDNASVCGGAYSLDGDATSPTLPSLNFGQARHMAIGAWVKPTEFLKIPFVSYIINVNDQFNIGLIRDIDRANEVIGEINTERFGDLNGPKLLNLNEWAHIMLTHNTTNNISKLYLNGQIIDTRNNLILDPNFLGNSPIIIGNDQSNQPFKGLIDEVFIHENTEQEFTDAMVSQVFNHCDHRASTPPIGDNPGNSVPLLPTFRLTVSIDGIERAPNSSVSVNPGQTINTRWNITSNPPDLLNRDASCAAYPSSNLIGIPQNVNIYTYGLTGSQNQSIVAGNNYYVGIRCATPYNTNVDNLITLTQ